MTTSAYIHIPFCKSKCNYCSFISFTEQDKKLGYVYSLLKEIDTYYSGEELKTLYFGGGTPSLIEPSLIEKIIKKFNFNRDCEITFEMNPDDAKLEYLQALYNMGINRISLGTQTFNNEILKLIGRRHSAEQAIIAVENAKSAGFKNINLDLIYGLPESKSIKGDLNEILKLDIPHISTYGLKIEEGSYFYTNFPSNLPNDDEQADMYLEINKTLENKGYSRYEISNFAKSGFESKHNLNYWNNSSYYGFGVAAHGYVDGIRYSNYTTLEKYLSNPTKHESGHIVSEEEKIEEEIFLGFRKASGINIKEFNEKFSIDFEEKYEKQLKKYMPDFIKKNNDNYSLTIEGVMLSNNILADFID